MNLFQPMENSTEELSNTIEIYCKIAYSEIKDIFNVPKNLTISDFIKYVNTTIRSCFNINSKYDIEVVEMGNHKFNCPNELIPKLEPDSEHTLYDKYGHLYGRHYIMAFYLRPVDPLKREFIRQENYNL